MLAGTGKRMRQKLLKLRVSGHASMQCTDGASGRGSRRCPRLLSAWGFLIRAAMRLGRCESMHLKH